MASRRLVSSGSAWETRYGYSRAVRVGSQVFVAGTTAVQDGAVVGAGDPRVQMERVLQIVADSLKALDASLEDVVRVRAYTTDMSHADELGRVLGETFGEIRPAATLLEVSALIHPDLLVEVEVDAVVE